MRSIAERIQNASCAYFPNNESFRVLDGEKRGRNMKGTLSIRKGAGGGHGENEGRNQVLGG